jgi:hypothetical protein
MNLKTFTLLFLGLFLLRPDLLAQQEEVPMYNVDFTCLPWEGTPLPQGVFYESDGEVHPVKFQRVRRTALMTYHGPSPLVFFRQETGPEGETIRIPVARADLSSGIERPLLLFVLRPEQPPGTFSVVVLDDRPEAFPAGSYKIINLNPAPLYCQVGDEKSELGPMSRWTVVPEAADGSGVVNTTVVRPLDGGDYKLVYRAQWPLNARMRTLVFLFPSQNLGMGDISTFAVSEYVPAAKK